MLRAHGLVTRMTVVDAGTSDDAVRADIANLVGFLCSEEASFISGQVIYVAGGPRG